MSKLKIFRQILNKYLHACPFAYPHVAIMIKTIPGFVIMAINEQGFLMIHQITILFLHCDVNLQIYTQLESYFYFQ